MAPAVRAEGFRGPLGGLGAWAAIRASHGPRLKAAVAASAELQERDALKNVSLAAAMTTALLARGVPEPTAHLASEMGVLALKRG